MKILLSPSKTIDFDSNIENNLISNPQLIDETMVLVNELKKYKSEDLSKLMKISEKLSILNFNRYKDFSDDFNEKNSKQAILIFKGDVYEPIEVHNYNDKDFKFLQKNLRIISGLYGIIKPMDRIKPYRLEMSTRLKNKRGSDLYKFWGDRLINYLNDEVIDSEVIINLASNEYFKAINKNKSKAKIIDIDFREFKNNEYKIIGIMAKRARGEMVNYIVKNKIERAGDLKDFNINNYKFNKSLSNESKLTFSR